MQIYIFKLKNMWLAFVGIICIIIGIVAILDCSATLSVNSTAITNKVIVIDAGHGAPDEGTLLLHK